jgi:hypothetical protein
LSDFRVEISTRVAGKVVERSVGFDAWGAELETAA